MNEVVNGFVPRVYLEPFGTPLYWGDETSGVLIAAVRAYCDTNATDEQLRLVRHYVSYVLRAPCWQAADPTEIDALRRMADRAEATHDGIWAVIDAALDLGIDPL